MGHTDKKNFKKKVDWLFRNFQICFPGSFQFVILIYFEIQVRNISEIKWLFNFFTREISTLTKEKWLNISRILKPLLRV